MRYLKFLNLAQKRILNKSSWSTDSETGFEFEIDQKLLEISEFSNLKFWYYRIFEKVSSTFLGTILRLHWHLSILWCLWFTYQWVLPIFLLQRLNLTLPPSLGSGLFAASSKRKRRGAALSPPSARPNSISPHLTHRLQSLLLDFI